MKTLSGPRCPLRTSGAGCCSVHANEDRARRISLGNTELGYAKLAIRCVVTTVDQVAGVKAGPEPLRTLADYRRAAQGGVAFGVKFAVLAPGKLSEGDEVTVSSWGEAEL